MAVVKNTRLLPAVPVVDSVPLMVWRESKVTVVTPAAEVAVTAKLLNVFMPVTACAFDAVFTPVKATL